MLYLKFGLYIKVNLYRVPVYKGLDCISIYLHVAWTMYPIETQDSFNH
jgi:hypothetical protein